MPSLRASLALVAALLIGCKSEPRQPKPPELSEAFSNLPLPPNPKLVSRSGGADVLQLTFRTPIELDQVANLYRDILSKGNWRLVSDLKNSDGSIALYAEQKGPPLWVRVWKATDGPGSMVQLTGAVLPKDSTKTRG